MTDKTPLGIPVLDDALGGGIPRGYVVLLEVDTGTRSDAFLSTFLANGLNNGELAYILCSDYPLRFPYEQLRHKGVDVDKALKAKKLVGIDAFTDAFGWGEFEPESGFSVHDLSNSRHVHDIIRKAVLDMKPKDNLRGVVDSLTSIIHAAREPDEVFNYLHHQMSAQKNHGNILIYTIAREAHDEEDLRHLEHIVDGVIALYKICNEEGWQIACQIEKMRGIDFEPQLYLYEVENGEIKLTRFAEFEDEDAEEDENEEEDEDKEPEVEEESKEELLEPVEPDLKAPEEIEEESPEVAQVSTEDEETSGEPNGSETTPPPILPVPEPEAVPEDVVEDEIDSDSNPEPEEGESRTPIIFDVDEPSEEVEESPPEEPEEPEDDEEDTFFF
jgi:KaiC/GvpD/RAD55 family RecA-like ATPase